jgi:hypothetical protein
MELLFKIVIFNLKTQSKTVMKTKVVLWGENAANEKILIGIELLERDNKILIHTIPHRVATEDFYQSMVNKWRENIDIVWPEERQTIERPLSISDGLLPDDIRVEKTDILARAQAEWHFVVLSTKLYEAYKEEIDELKAKVDTLTEYSEAQWNELVEFWNKVSNHVKDKTLYKDQASTLKERTNILFDKLKDLKKNLYKQADQKSKEVAAELLQEVDKISEKIQQGLGIGPLFDELKQIQNRYYKAQMNKKDKNSVWEKLDSAFKALKDNKGKKQDKEHKNSEESHINNRLAGLEDAIKRMEKSIARDKDEIDFQNKRINQTEGKLELQLREAKMKMIEQSIVSKKEKLDDMLKTKVALDAKVASMAEKKLKREAEQKVKEKIATDIESQKEILDSESEKLSAAAAEISQSKQKSLKSMVSDFVEEVKEVAEDVSITAKAAFEVAENKMEDISEKVEDKAEQLKGALEDAADDLEDKAEKIAEDLEIVKDRVKEKIEIIEDKVEDIVDNIIEKTSEVADKISEKFKGDAEKDSDVA